MRESLPPFPVNVLAPLFPVIVFAKPLPTPSISLEPVRIKFSTLSERVKVEAVE